MVSGCENKYIRVNEYRSSVLLAELLCFILWILVCHVRRLIFVVNSKTEIDINVYKKHLQQEAIYMIL